MFGPARHRDIFGALTRNFRTIKKIFELATSNVLPQRVHFSGARLPPGISEHGMALFTESHLRVRLKMVLYLLPLITLDRSGSNVIRHTLTSSIRTWTDKAT